MADWPVSRPEMDPYFRKAAELLPLTGGGGTLSRSFPSYKSTLGMIDPGPQARLLLGDLERAEICASSEGDSLRAGTAGRSYRAGGRRRARVQRLRRMLDRLRARRHFQYRSAAGGNDPAQGNRLS